MTTARKLVAGALAAATVLIVAQAAIAATGDVRVRTTDPDPGGEAYFLHTGKGLSLKACDIQKDGVSVFAYASYHKRLDNQVSDHDGANGNCLGRSIQASEGRTVWVKVCLVDQDEENVLGFCSRWKRGKA
jgi:hypothetical protein